jgi:hypothetical protein
MGKLDVAAGASAILEAMGSKQPERAAGPYGSANDLPSVIELRQQIQSMKMLTRFVARGERARVRELEAQLNRITKSVDDFYTLLGPRNWVYHDMLPFEDVLALVLQPADVAEHALINVYADAETLRFMVRRLRRFEVMHSRLNLVDRACADHAAGRYYAVVLVLLAVMDGFVNDLDVGRRRGLHAREAHELAAWDSIVGHHLGLTSAHHTFTRSFFRTADEPVHELYRNGIVHGTLTNFDNVIVASKAWNRLFAVADWAASVENAMVEKPAKPTWREIGAQLTANARAQRALKEWSPSVLTADDEAFSADSACIRVVEFLDAWRRENYGAMAAFIPSKLAEESPRKTAGRMRNDFAQHTLKDYTILRVEFVAAAVAEAHVEVEFGDGVLPAKLRWIREGEDGLAATPPVAGEWRLYTTGPWAMLARKSGEENEKD